MARRTGVCASEQPKRPSLAPSLASADQPNLIARPDPGADRLVRRHGQASRFAASRDFIRQTGQAWPALLRIMLINGLLNDCLDAHAETFRARSMARGQKLPNIATAHPELS